MQEASQTLTHPLTELKRETPTPSPSMSALDASIEGVVKNFGSSQTAANVPTLQVPLDNLPYMLLQPHGLVERIRTRMPEIDKIDRELLTTISEVTFFTVFNW